jgi:hypothetical protein
MEAIPQSERRQRWICICAPECIRLVFTAPVQLAHRVTVAGVQNRSRRVKMLALSRAKSSGYGSSLLSSSHIALAYDVNRSKAADPVRYVTSYRDTGRFLLNSTTLRHAACSTVTPGTAEHTWHCASTVPGGAYRKRDDVVLSGSI